MIVLYGGTFDPVHIGHMIVANEIYHHFRPDRFIWMPARQNPLKENYALATDDERLAMLNIAVDILGFGEVSDIEINRPGRSYTYDTVKELSLEDDDIRIIIGTDQYVQLDKWFNIEGIQQLGRFIVINRDTDQLTDDEQVDSFFVPRIDISSTLIRERLKEAASVKLWLHEKIERFVKERKIYEKEKGNETR